MLIKPSIPSAELPQEYLQADIRLRTHRHALPWQEAEVKEDLPCGFEIPTGTHHIDGHLYPGANQLGLFVFIRLQSGLGNFQTRPNGVYMGSLTR